MAPTIHDLSWIKACIFRAFDFLCNFLLINLPCLSFSAGVSLYLLSPLDQSWKTELHFTDYNRHVSSTDSFYPPFIFEWKWKNKFINVFLAEEMNENRLSFD